ncbi:unnamed protein product, partial [Nesidiocoris tenuis]
IFIKLIDCPRLRIWHVLRHIMCQMCYFEKKWHRYVFIRPKMIGSWSALVRPLSAEIWALLAGFLVLGVIAFKAVAPYDESAQHHETWTGCVFVIISALAQQESTKISGHNPDAEVGRHRSVRNVLTGRHRDGENRRRTVRFFGRRDDPERKALASAHDLRRNLLDRPDRRYGTPETSLIRPPQKQSVQRTAKKRVKSYILRNRTEKLI